MAEGKLQMADLELIGDCRWQIGNEIIFHPGVSPAIPNLQFALYLLQSLW
jgi:hypothetical protein